MDLLILFLKNVLVMFDLLYLGFSRFDECGLVVDDVFQTVDELPHLPSGDPACAFRGVKPSPLRVLLFGMRGKALDREAIRGRGLGWLAPRVVRH